MQSNLCDTFPCSCTSTQRTPKTKRCRSHCKPSAVSRFPPGVGAPVRARVAGLPNAIPVLVTLACQVGHA